MGMVTSASSTELLADRDQRDERVDEREEGGPALSPTVLSMPDEAWGGVEPSAGVSRGAAVLAAAISGAARVSNPAS